MNENRCLSNLHRRCPLLILAVVAALVLTLLWAVTGYAGVDGGWHATEFQVQNMDSEQADFTAHFYKPDGTEVLSFTGSISPGRSAYYQPEATHGLPPGFTGTLRLESDQNIAGTILHVATTTPGFNGNDVFEMVADDVTAKTYFAPLVERDHDGVTSQILVGNLGTAATTATIFIHAPDGTLVSTPTLASIPVNGNASLNLERIGCLGSPFTGSAVISATQPVWVDVAQIGGVRWATYPASPAGNTELYAPAVAQEVVPTISIQNVSGVATTVEIGTAAGAPCDSPVDLPPWGSRRVAPSCPWEDSYVITSTGAPIAAVVSMRDTAGASAYTALDRGQASCCHFAPILFNGYDDWDTSLWVYNPNDSTATVKVTFTGTPDPASWVEIVQIGPSEDRASWSADVGTHYAARLTADKPIFVLVAGTASDKNDGRLVYRATASSACIEHNIYLPLVLRGYQETQSRRSRPTGSGFYPFPGETLYEEVRMEKNPHRSRPAIFQRSGR